MDKQRGGSFTVNGWLAMVLLSLIAVEGVAIHQLLRVNHALQVELLFRNFLSPQHSHGGTRI
jgi:hypothetical protein